jgi:hypothetical protein
MTKSHARMATDFFVAYLGNLPSVPTITDKLRGELEQHVTEGVSPDESVDTMLDIAHHITNTDAVIRDEPRLSAMLLTGDELSFDLGEMRAFVNASLMRAVYSGAVSGIHFDVFTEDARAPATSDAFFLSFLKPEQRRQSTANLRDELKKANLSPAQFALLFESDQPLLPVDEVDKFVLSSALGNVEIAADDIYSLYAYSVSHYVTHALKSDTL